jgi:hypothetical protein
MFTNSRTVSITRAKYYILMKQEKQTPSRGKRKLILTTSESDHGEQLERKSKQKKMEEGKRKEKEEDPQLVKKTVSSCKQVFTRRNKGKVIKDFPVEKDLAAQLVDANQVIASQRQEITVLSQKNSSRCCGYNC